MRNNCGLKFKNWLGLALVCFGIAFSTDASANQCMKPENIRTLIQKARDAWVARDVDALVQLFTPDGEIIVPGQRWQGQAKIRQEVARFARQYSDVKIEIRRIIIENNQAAVEWHYEDTEKATGIRSQAEDAILVDFKDNHIWRWREYFDVQTPVSKP